MRARSKLGATFSPAHGWRKRCTTVIVGLAALLLAVSPSADASGLQPIGLRVEGGEENWHAQRLFGLRWSNPPDPVAAVHYRVLDPFGQVAVEETRLPWPATSIQQVSVPPTPGAYRAEVWLEDSVGAEGAPATASLRFDDARPGDVEPLPGAGWIGRTAFPYTVHLGHPAGPLPISGIHGYAVSIDTSPAASPCAGESTCSDAETDLRGGMAADSLQVGELPEGVNYIHAVAVSGSGTRSAVPGNAVLKVDGTDPVTRLEGGGDGWSNKPLTLRATATDPASGMVATEEAAGGPFTAIRIDGGAPTTAAGDTVTATVIASGVHTVAYYARDAAGNVADGGTSNGMPNHPPATAVVKIDRELPELAFAGAQDPLDPERIEVRASDSYSGLDPNRGFIAVRRLGSGERFVELPTEQAGGLLRARWNSDAYPTGDYEFRATAYDMAGNSASTLSRSDGSAMRLSSPLKLPVKLLTRSGQRTVPYGRGTWFGGRLLAGRRTSLADVPLQVIERFESGGVPGERISTVRTGAGGAFGVHLAAGPSRQVIAVVPPTSTLSGASSVPLTLSVHGHLGLRVSSAIARIGGAPVVFSGRVAPGGAEIPPDGKVVQLQFRLPGLPWSEFRTVRTDPRGRFRYAYRFADDDSRGVRFQFRAFAPAQAGWPFEPAGSRPVAVRGA